MFSYLNGLDLGLDRSTNELIMMDRRDGGDRVLWRWEGKSLINKTGLAMEATKSGVLGLEHNGLINQHWRLEGKNICHGNNLVLDIPHSNTDPGINVIVWKKNHPYSSNQMWKLEYH